MEEMYGLHPIPPDYSDKALMSPDNLILPSDYHPLMTTTAFPPESPRMPVFGSDELISAVSAISDAACSTALPDEDTSSTAIKAKIASHPHYPRLLKSYMDCYKVVAPAEMGRILEEIRRESDVRRQEAGHTLGADPELDEFMETYCEILDKYKSDLSRPFDEAKSFLSEIETQLRHLCNDAFVPTPSEEGAASSDEEHSGEVDVQDLQQKDEERDLKDQLLRKFGSHISGLRLEFSKKKKKKGKLPKEATQTLFEWWRTHYKWPYPTEADKMALAETTGLDQRQINNWFINQRKRHWKPSEDLQFALMDNLSRQYLTNDT